MAHGYQYVTNSIPLFYTSLHHPCTNSIHVFLVHYISHALTQYLFYYFITSVMHELDTCFIFITHELIQYSITFPIEYYFVFLWQNFNFNNISSSSYSIYKYFYWILFYVPLAEVYLLKITLSSSSTTISIKYFFVFSSKTISYKTKENQCGLDVCSDGDSTQKNGVFCLGGVIFLFFSFHKQRILVRKKINKWRNC